METGLTPVTRKIIVCVRKGCTQCDGVTTEAPEDCPYLILHALDTSVGGMRQMGRRSGKTTLLVQQANELAEAGQPVYFLTFNMQMGRCLKQAYGLNRHVKIFSKHQAVREKLSGLSPGWLFVDEVLPEELTETGVLARHRLVAGYYT